MGIDPRYIPPSDREASYILAKEAAHYSNGYEGAILEVVDHAAFMDERDARQRDLIRRLGDTIYLAREYASEDIEFHGSPFDHETKSLLVEARGVEATNE